MTTLEMLQSLKSEICPECGSKKQNHQSVCRRCYKKLPRPMQRALYNLVGDGYEEALTAALAYLRQNVEDYSEPKPRRRRGSDVG